MKKLLFTILSIITFASQALAQSTNQPMNGEATPIQQDQRNKNQGVIEVDRSQLGNDEYNKSRHETSLKDRVKASE